MNSGGRLLVTSRRGDRSVKPSSFSRQLGFTIVEVLIVLAVTSLLFLIAILYIGGKQNRASFLTSVNDLKQQLEQTINETQSGFYANSGDFTCNGHTNSTPPTISAGTGTQGVNGSCIFMGKVVYFNPSSGNNEQFRVFSLAGNRLNSCQDNVSTLAEARPVVVHLPGNNNNLTTQKLNNGLSFVWAYSSTKTNDPFAFGVLNTLSGGTPCSSPGPIGGTDNSSSTSGMGLYDYTQGYSLSASDSIDSVANKLSTSARVAPRVNLGNTLQFCMASGGTNQSGLFTIDNGLHITLAIKNGKSC